ncbi:MAG: reactive intermediate/imine deaminase [Deltaproteobacteria bacterium]|nr:reactive intermediate/imine deaminase [Deltaproteobacteria bacterium]
MADKRLFETDKAAILGGPYPQAVIYNNLVFLSGQGPVDPETNRISLGTIEEETRTTLENVRIILEGSGSSLDKILQLKVYLQDMNEYGRFNDVYKQFFYGDNYPARSCIQSRKLPFGIRVEIDAIAYI